MIYNNILYYIYTQRTVNTSDFKPRVSIWTQVAASCSQASDIPSPEMAIASVGV